MQRAFITLVLSVSIFLAANKSEAASSQAGTFTNPLNPGPDPYLQWHDGNYYLTATQGDCIRMWRAPSLQGLKTAPGTVVWRDSDPSRSLGIWAPSSIS